MRNINIIIIYNICLLLIIISCKMGICSELSMDESISVATEFAQQNKYDTSDADIEVLKVKNKHERGPIRFVWLMNNFSHDEVKELIKKEFWIIYFYPKGLIDGRKVLGGGFCVIVELYSGDILFSFADQ